PHHGACDPSLREAGFGRETRGSTTYPAAKANRDKSLSSTRSGPEAVYGPAPQDPCARVKAALPEPVRHITRPGISPTGGRNLEDVPGSSSSTEAERQRGSEQAGNAASTERRGRWTETARSVS